MTSARVSSPIARVPRRQAWRAVVSRDARYDGRFVYAVSSTRIFCRPSCPSRRPLEANVRFFATGPDAAAAGFRACKRCEPLAMDTHEVRLVGRARAYLEQHGDRTVSLAELARASGASASHLQRTFTRVAGMSPKRYHDAVRTGRLRQRLRDGAAVSRAAVDAGFGSSSRVYERATPLLGMTPTEFRRGGAGLTIRYAVMPSPLGHVCVALTPRGICSVAFGDSPAALERELRGAFPAATIHPAAAGDRRVNAVMRVIERQQPATDIPLDLVGTEFQRRVWEELRRIPRGETRSYGEIAATLGRPGASRAVARACATNPVAVVVPCHRVVRADGDVSGYRWGVERKRRLLARERVDVPG